MAIRRRHNGGIRDEFLDAIITHGGNAIIREGWRQAGNAVGEHLGSTAGNFVRANGERAVNYIGGLRSGSAEHATNEVATARINPRPRDDTARRGDFINQLTKTLISNVAKPSKRRNPALPAPVEPVPEPTPTSQSNSPATTQMTGNDGEEIPVVPPPRKIAKMTPDYFTNICPYYTSFVFNSTGEQSKRVQAYAVLLRLNSIWDPVVGSLSDSQPQGRDQWATVFNYYRVLESHWKIRWHNQNVPICTPQLRTAAVTANYGSPLKGNFICGYELVEDDTSSLLSDSIYTFMATKHAKRTELHAATPNSTATVDQVYVVSPGQAVTEIHYTPETWDHHVQTNTTAERWTPIASSPTVDHYAALRCFHKGSDDIATNKDGGIYCEVYVEFKVQWREAASPLIKLVDSTPATGNDTAPNT